MLRTILVPLDGSALAEQAVGTAALLARASHASVDLATVREPMPFVGADESPWAPPRTSAFEKYVESTAAELSSGASIAATGTVLRGQATEMLCDRARALHADLVVMTSHGRSGVSRAWLGSVADAMIRRCDAPVLVLRPELQALHPSQLHRSFSHILVPLDGSALSTDILDCAVDVARLTGARITLLRIVPPLPLVSAMEPAFPFVYVPFAPDEAATKHLVELVRTELGQTAARLHDETGLTIDTTVIVDEHTARAIVDYAKGHGVDLIAMSTHGRGASRFLLGSVADKVLRSSERSVLMHHPVATADTASVGEERVGEELPAIGTV